MNATSITSAIQPIASVAPAGEPVAGASPFAELMLSLEGAGVPAPVAPTSAGPVAPAAEAPALPLPATAMVAAAVGAGGVAGPVASVISAGDVLPLAPTVAPETGARGTKERLVVDGSLPAPRSLPTSLKRLGARGDRPEKEKEAPAAGRSGRGAREVDAPAREPRPIGGDTPAALLASVQPLLAPEAEVSSPVARDSENEGVVPGASETTPAWPTIALLGGAPAARFDGEPPRITSLAIGSATANAALPDTLTSARAGAAPALLSPATGPAEATSPPIEPAPAPSRPIAPAAAFADVETSRASPARGEPSRPLLAGIAAPQPSTVAANTAAQPAPVPPGFARGIDPAPVAAGPWLPPGTAVARAADAPGGRPDRIMQTNGPVTAVTTALNLDPRIAPTRDMLVGAPVEILTPELAPVTVASVLAMPSPELAPVPVVLPEQSVSTVAASAGANPALAAAEQLIEGQLDLAHESEWLDQLTRDIARTAEADGRASFRLAPEHLGRLDVELEQSAAGANIRLTAETETARAIIADAQPRLLAEARAQGLRIADAQVDLAGHGHGGAHDPRREDGNRPHLFTRTGRDVPAEAPAPGRPTHARSERYA